MPKFPLVALTLRPTWGALVALLAGALSVGSATADDGNLLPAKVLPAYQQECAACHLAYPPGMLPQASWRRIMTQLDQHYGTDASLDEASVKQIAQWLNTHAGTYKRTGTQAPPQDRITRSAWFERKHSQLDAAVWKHASVKSAANCAACHTGAERGNYSDDNLRFPIGLDARYRRFWEDD